MKRNAAITLIMLSIALMLLAVYTASIVKAEPARIWTDKTDYAPEETVTIYGEGFQGNVTITVIRPDGTINDPQNGIMGNWAVNADENGTFETTYQLDGITGKYTVTATDGTNTATTTFTDANKVRFQTSGLPAGVKITINLKIDPGSDEKSLNFTSPGPSDEVATGNNKVVAYSGFPTTVDVSGVTYVLTATSPSSPFNTGTGQGTIIVNATYAAATYSVTFDATVSPGLPDDVYGSTVVLTVTIGAGPSTSVTKAELPKTFINIAYNTPIKYSYESPLASATTGKQYRWDSTSGTGSASGQTGQTGSFTLTSNSAVTAVYKTQYRLTMATNFGTTSPSVGDHWYDAGTVLTISADAPSVVDGERYVWNGWTGTGTGSYSGMYNPANVTMNGPITETASWTHQYRLTIQTSGLHSASYPTDVKLDGSNVGTAYDSSAYIRWFDENDYTGAIGVDGIVSGGNGTQFVFTKWNEDSSADNPRASVQMDGPKIFTAVYKTQYYLTVQSAYGLTGGSGWYDAGTDAYATVAPLTVAGPAGTRYVFTHWSGDASGSTSPSEAIAMNGPKVAVANWKTQYLVTFGWSGLDADASGKVVTITVAGSNVVKNAGDSSYSAWLDAGTTLSYSFEEIVGSSMTNKAYKLVRVVGNSTSTTYNFGPISGPISETGNYGSIILSIVKKAPSAVFVGDTIRYVYEVRNTGTTSATGIRVTDGSLTVSFVGGDANGNHELDPGETWVYTATYGPVSAADKPSITNKAKVSCTEGAVAEDTATVAVYELEITKTAETSYTRTYTWSISKTANPSTVILNSETATETVSYSIKLSATYEDSDWKVTGTITITNPAPIDAVITAVKDIVSPNIEATINFGTITFPYTLKAGETLTLTYSADLPDANSRTNTVTVTMQNFERPFLWDLTGNWVIRVYYGGNYDHDFTLTMASDGLAFAGIGGYPAGEPYSITETITGVTALDDVFWHSLYNNSYFWDAKGIIASDGTMSGTWTSSIGQSGTWNSISGAATLVKKGTGTSGVSATADVVFGAPTTMIDESVTVSDTYSGGPQGTEVYYPGTTLTYKRTIGPYNNIGIYTVENTASFVTCDTKSTGHDDSTVTVYRIGSAVTTSSFYLFDYDAADGRQFKLIYTPDMPNNPGLYRLTASNPGQFYYNIFYYGTVETDNGFVITIPDPFVTQGANPVHIYDSITSTSDGYLLPSGHDITSQFIIEWSTDGRTCTITPIGTYSGPVYITIHLDYGDKKILGGLSKDSNNDAINAFTQTVMIKDLTEYTFSVSGPLEDSDTVENRNVFKRDPGFVGLITDSEGNPIAGVKVQIYGPDGKLLATVYTDKDGWYFYNYKYTGKAATFTIKLPEYDKTATVTIKSNSLTKTDFTIQ